MCGLSAVISISPNNNLQNTLNTMISSQAHRGPDGSGTWINKDMKIGLGHNRLAIIETSQDGNQPWINCNNGIVIIWNGEIYNHKELRTLLEGNGFSFTTNSDTEVLEKAYSHFGNDVFKYLEGMFSIIIFDQLKNNIILARDRFGIKPLLYYKQDRFIAFASETKALRMAFSECNDVDEIMTSHFLNTAEVILEDRTFYKNIKNFPIANYGVLDLESLNITYHPFWKLPSSYYSKNGSNELQNSVMRSVEKHLLSDVPLACALSGGIDSSIITLYADSVRKQKNSKLQTLSVVWPHNREIDESVWIREVLQNTTISSLFTSVPDSKILELVNQVLEAQDEPFASTTLLAQYQIYSLAKEAGIKVVLDGQGADELFLGYQNLIPKILRSQFRAGNLMKFFGNCFAMFTKRHSFLMDRKTLLEHIAKSIVPNFFLKKLKANFSEVDLETLRHRLVFNGNLQGLLRYQDRNSMANSVESRVPYLDHYVVEAAFSFKPIVLMAHGKTKYPLRQSFKEILPKSIFSRLSKFGYTTPESIWLQFLLENRNMNPTSAEWRKYIVDKWRAHISISRGQLE